jgi:hypothetical protein
LEEKWCKDAHGGVGFVVNLKEAEAVVAAVMVTSELTPEVYGEAREKGWADGVQRSGLQVRKRRAGGQKKKRRQVQNNNLQVRHLLYQECLSSTVLEVYDGRNHIKG